MKKITITNAYTWDNKGDAGILLGIIEELKKIYNGDVEFTILSFTPEKDEKHYCEDITVKKVYSNILNPHPYKHTKIGKIKAMLKLAVRAVKISIGLKFNRENTIKTEKSIQALNESDIIVVCGGGFLGGKKLESLMHLYQIDVNTQFNKPVFVTDYPKDIKAFYMKQNPDGKTVAAADLLVPGIGEIIGGSQREENYDKLLNRMKELNMPIENYEWYLDLRKYGSCVHSGFGLGFERAIMYLTGMQNIRDVIPFPRTPKNCEF